MVIFLAHDVFISYAKDKIVADAICEKLENNNIRCWIAPRDILPGADWGNSIVDAIHSSKVLVLIFSSNSNESIQVTRELERAVNQGITIIPFRIEDTTLSGSMEYFIGPAHWLDARDPPLEKHIDKLVKITQVLLDTI